MTTTQQYPYVTVPSSDNSVDGAYFSGYGLFMNGQELKQTRKSLGLSQENFGAAIGRSKMQIIRYEKGDALITSLIERAVRDLVREQAEAAE
ncbi:hypothetical protein LCGC14_1827800 [marine sediment metagenome]|uniref:HTH cro/C1-type domain-containing protein n=1 Tax=marine sediment metagenome TaxID=412755 RepID=A0A0F9IWI9_9ZZZZ